MERLVKWLTGLMMACHFLFLMEFNMIMCLMIDIGNGEPVRKLPYNRSDNPYDVAEKMASQRESASFLTVNKLWKSLILQNTGQKQFTPDPSFCDPYTGSCTYTPGQPSKPAERNASL